MTEHPVPLAMGNSNSLVLQIFLLLALFQEIRADDVGAPMEESEKLALYSAIQGFVGRDWNGSDLYPDPCGWTPVQGVSCDVYNGFWYVTTMSIGPTLENSLDCAEDADFSPPLFELKHLKSLTFFKCFSGQNGNITIPAKSWENLAGSLETLEFRSNKGLSGNFPSSLCSLRRLRSLVLVDNALSGELPSELGKFDGLQRLVISGNNFSSQIPAPIGFSMANLLILDLSRNYLTGNLPGSIGNLRSLLKLDLSYNLLSGKIPPELGNLTSLTLLDLRKNGLSGGIPPSLESMASLKEMLLSENPLGGEIQSFEWQNLKELSTLDLSATSLSGEVPESMAEIKNLRALHLNGNNFTGELKFSCEFYRRIGRGFSAWGNPNLSNSTKSCTEEAPTSKPATEAMARSSGSSSVRFSLLCQAIVVLVFLLR